MFIVGKGKSFFGKTLSKFNIKTIAPLCVIHIPLKMLALGEKEARAAGPNLLTLILILQQTKIYKF